MNVSALVATANRLSESHVASQAQTLVLKKAIAVQQAGAMALLAAVPTPPHPTAPAAAASPPAGEAGHHLDAWA